MTECANNLISEESVDGSTASQVALKRVAVIGWLAILLGFAMQGLIVATKFSSGDETPGVQILLGLTQGITWSFLVCTGIGIGITMSKARASLVGLLAMVCAPLAMAAAKGSQKVMASLVGAGDQPAALSLAAISGLKAIEYGILGWLLGSLVEKENIRLLPYIAVGAAIGLGFGGGISALSYHVSIAKGFDPALAQVLGTTLNEVVFPIGCSVVIYMGQLVSRHVGIISGRA